MKKDNENIDNLLYGSLEGYEVKPSPDLKKRIKRNMFYNNLYHFHFWKLFTGLSGVLTIISIVLYLNIDPEKTENIPTIVQYQSSDNILNENIEKKKEETIAQNQSIENNKPNPGSFIKPAIEKDNATKEDPIINPSKEILQDKKTVFIKKGEAIGNKTQEQPAMNVDKVHNQNAAQTLHNDIHTNNQNKIIAGNEHSNQNEIQPNASNTGTPENKENNPIQIKSQLIQQTKNLLQVPANTGHVSQNLSGNNHVETNIADNMLNRINFKNAKLPIDPIPELPDTLYNFMGTPIIFNTKKYSIDLFWSGYMHQSSFTQKNAESENFSKSRNSAVMPTNGYKSFGANFNLNYKHLIFQGGISYINYTDEFIYKELLVNPRQKYFTYQNDNPYNYVDNGNYYLIDTIGGYWHYTYLLDSIIHVKDSIWIYKTDTQIVNAFDTILGTIYDTSKNKKLINYYSYFEIPVMAGYEIPYKNFDFAIKGGIITSILISANGDNTTQSNDELVPINGYIPFRKLYFSWIISLQANYLVSECWNLFAEPYYRQGIGSMLKNNTVINHGIRAYGTRFGIKYKF